MKGNSRFLKAIGWFSGILFFLIGVVNTFWGNDPVFGAGIVVLSLFYLPPVNRLITQKTGIAIPVAAKIVPGLLILWAALGVGELTDKTAMMLRDLVHLFGQQ